MASITLVESAKLTQNELIQGIIENIVTVDRFFEVLPFDGIEGNALAYNRENALGDVQVAGVGATVTAKNPATFSQVTSTLTTIIGDAEVNGLIQATRSDVNDQRAIQVASKAKAAGRQYRDMLINGTGAGDEFAGLLGLLAAGQTLEAGANGANLTFDILDALIDQVTDKDGQVDFILMPARTVRSYYALLRGLGGANISEVVTLSSGAQVPGYRNIPIFRNDWMPTNQTHGTGTTCTTILAGTLDDGSRTHGIAGLTARQAAGIQVVNVGEHQDRDESITRVKWYCGLANYSEKGLAGVQGVLN